MESLSYGEGSDSMFHMAPEHASSTTRWLEARRELVKVEEELQHKRDEFRRLTDKFAAQEAEIEDRNAQLQQHLLSFDKFLQDNYQKKIRAEQKAEQEAQQRAIKEKEIEELRAQLLEGEREREDLGEAVARSMRFVRYLDEVVMECPDFDEVGDIERRLETLERTNADLVDSSRKLSVDTESLERQVQEVQLEMENLKRSGTRKLELLRHQLEEEQLKTILTASNSYETIDKILDHARSVGEIVLGCANLYDISAHTEQTLHRRKTESAPSLGGRLDQIAESIINLQQIRDIAYELSHAIATD